MDHSQHHHAASAAGMDDEMMSMPNTGHRCQMSMLFTWNTQDLCLVFRWWHVSGPLSLVLSLLAVVALGMGYEYLRLASRRYEARCAGLSIAGDESSPLLPASTVSTAATTTTRRGNPRGHVTKALFYGAQVFYSFFIMLLFMTYNGWVMISVAVGAVLGYLVWGAEASVEKSVACH